MTKLNLGCGEKKKEGWLNVDIDSKYTPDMILDLEKMENYKTFKDGSIDEILIDNVLEHLRLHYIDFMNECHRMLKNGGIITIVVPNFFNWKHRLKYLLGRFEYSDGWCPSHCMIVKGSWLRNELRHRGFNILNSHSDWFSQETRIVARKKTL